MYFMWFGAPILCFQILQCRSSGSGDDLTFPDGRWASQNERAHWIDSDYVRRLKIAEQAVEGAGIRNSHGGGGTLIFTAILHPFLAPNLGWNYLWDEHGPLKPPSAGFFGPGCLPVSPCSTCCHRKLCSYVGQRALCSTTRGACSSQVCQAILFEKCPSFMRSNCQDA